MKRRTNRERPDPRWNTAAAVDSGSFRDKTAGMDPAAAPMETDAEAGGSSQPGGLGEPPSPLKKGEAKGNQASYGTAMRRLAGMPSADRGWWPLLPLLIVVIVAAVLLTILATV